MSLTGLHLIMVNYDKCVSYCDLVSVMASANRKVVSSNPTRQSSSLNLRAELFNLTALATMEDETVI